MRQQFPDIRQVELFFRDAGLELPVGHSGDLIHELEYVVCNNPRAHIPILLCGVKEFLIAHRFLFFLKAVTQTPHLKLNAANSFIVSGLYIERPGIHIDTGVG